MGRWVKLYESFLDWEWHDCPEMVSLFVHLLVLAQHEDYDYRGITINRGQLVTSRSKLAEITGLSQQTIRTCLSRLESTNEITKQSTNANTLITICNYDRYQRKTSDTNQPNNQQTNQQSTNHQTRIIEYNNIAVVDNARAREEIMSQLMTEKMCMMLRLDADTYRQLAEEVLLEWEITEESDPSKKHFVAVMRKKAEAWRKSRQSAPAKKTKEQIKAEALAMAQRAAIERAKRYGTDN